MSSLFLGNFAFLLSRSHSFTTDLLLGSAPQQQSQEQIIRDEWVGRLSELQAKSLVHWQAETVAKAVAKLQDAMNQVTATSTDTTLAAWEGEHDPSAHGSGDSLLTRSRSVAASRAAAAKGTLLSVPSQPSLAVLSAVRHLNSSVRRVGLHRTQAHPEIVRDLLAAFEAKCRGVVKEFVPIVRRLGEPERTQVAVQTAWDLTYLRRVWGMELAEKGWGKGVAQFVDLVSRKVTPDAPDSCADECGSQVDSPTLATEIEQATLAYVQRTQNAVAFVLGPQARQAGVGAGAGAGGSLLPFGAPASGAGELKGVGLTGMAVPGPRLGLLPTEVRAGVGGR